MLKRYTLFLLLFAALASDGFGQTTVFSDDFNRPALTGGPTTYTPTVTAGDGGASIVSNILVLTNDASGTTNANGRVFVRAPISGLSSPFDSILTNNTGIMTWRFNMRQIRTDPSGFDGGNYGVAVVLAGTESDFRLGNGYAVVLGQSGATDAVRLAQYSDGVDANGNITNIIASTDFGANFLSIGVDYDPSTDNWTLYVRDDGASAFADPATLTISDKVGSTTANTIYTSETMTSFGFLWNYGTGGSQTASFDNYKVTVTTPGSDPNAALTGTDPGAIQFLTGTNNNVIYSVKVDVSTAAVNLTDVGFATTGNYVATDIQGTGFRLYYSTDATLDLSDTELGNQVSSSDGINGDVLIFSGLNQTIDVGSGYLFLTADISSSATALHTLSVSVPAENDFAFDGTYTTAGSNLVAGNIHTFYALPPVLTADASNNNVDNEIDITFTNIPAWLSASPIVKVNDTTLTDGTDYDLTAGHLILKPGGGRACLRTASVKTVKVSATGYTDATVSQTINVGAVNLTTSTAAISLPLALNTERTVTVTSKDQYNNLVMGYVFTYDVTITNNDGTTAEIYTINEIERTASVADLVLGATNASGVATFKIKIPTTVDADDGVSVQVQSTDGVMNVGSAFEFTGFPVPSISVSSMVPVNSNIIKGRDNNILQRFNFTVLAANATLNSITVTTAGTYVVGDIKTNGFKLWYSADTLFNSITDVLLSSQAVVASANNIVFGSLSSTILKDASGHYFVTVDLSNSAITNNTVQLTSTPFANITFAAANLSGTNPIPAGGTKTIVAISLPLTEHFDYAVGSVTSNGAGWVNTSGTTGQVTVETGNLTYTGYDMPATGKSITLTASESEDVRLVFPEVTTGKVYASFLLNVSAIPGNDVYFIHLGNGISNFTSRVYAKVDGAGFALSIGKTAVGTYSGTLNLNQTYLIVISYEIVDGSTTDDIVNLWINPDLSGVEPTPVISSSTGNDVTLIMINAFYVRQATNIPTCTIDAIRIATSWADAPLPVELTSFTARAAGSVVNLNWETKTEVDNNGFDVERNSTGTWHKIGFVEGHGTANSPKYYNFTDKSVTGNKIQYRLRQVDNDGTFEYSNVVEVELAPTTFALDQNYPNPFNPATVIRFSLPTASVVTLNVYNTLGEKVVTLLNGAMESGYHQVSFDAANLPSGLYLYEIKAGEFSSIKKMILMK